MDMIRDNKKLVIMGAGVIIAVLVAVFLVLPSGGDKEPIADEISEIETVFSQVDIMEGDIITDDMVVSELVENDLEEDNSNTFQYIEDVIGSRALVDISEGSSVKYQDVNRPIMDESAQMYSGLADKVPEGLRAVLMPTGPVQEMVNFLEVGDRIDLVITHATGEGHQTSTPFPNVEVLMINNSQNMDSPVNAEEGGQVIMSGGKSVILAMSPEQAESILNMRVSGVLETVQITLRGSQRD